MRFKQAGNKRDIIAMVVHNADTVSIPVGTPIVLNMNGTNNGLDVCLISTAAADSFTHGLKYGVVTRTLNVGDYGESIVFGIHTNVILSVNTRAGTSGGSSWSTVTSFSSGQALTFDTVNNAFTTCASTQALAQSATAGSYVLSIPGIPAILAQSVASNAGSATSTANSLTVSTISVQAFIRML
jgi:hypothetical protein